MNKATKSYQVGPDRTRVQAVLTKAGRDALGRDYIAEHALSPAYVRRAGLGRLGRGALVASLAAGTLAGGIIATGDKVFNGTRHFNAAEVHEDQQATEQVAAELRLQENTETVDSHASEKGQS